MDETKLKRLTLFILETLILQRTNMITEMFAYAFNEFIYTCYRENKEILSIIYDIEILDEFIKGNYEILSLNQMFQLIERYRGFDGYVDLLEDINSEVDTKVNDLANLFIAYQQELVNLYYADYSIYFPKGYPRILQ